MGINMKAAGKAFQEAFDGSERSYLNKLDSGLTSAAKSMGMSDKTAKFAGRAAMVGVAGGALGIANNTSQDNPGVGTAMKVGIVGAGIAAGFMGGAGKQDLEAAFKSAESYGEHNNPIAAAYNKFNPEAKSMAESIKDGNKSPGIRKDFAYANSGMAASRPGTNGDIANFSNRMDLSAAPPPTTSSSTVGESVVSSVAPSGGAVGTKNVGTKSARTRNSGTKNVGAVTTAPTSNVSTGERRRTRGVNHMRQHIY